MTRRTQLKWAKKGWWDDSMANGHDPRVTPAVKRFIMRGIVDHLFCTSTTGGTHASGSWHYQKDGLGRGRAADVAPSLRDPLGYVRMRTFYIAEFKRERAVGHQWHELFGPGSHYIKEGTVHPGQFPGHTNHVHGAPQGVN